MSLKLKYADFDGKKLPLSNNHYGSCDDNHITIVVGKNSVGKSRFLSAIVGVFESLERDGRVQKVRSPMNKSVSPLDDFYISYELAGYNCSVHVDMGKSNLKTESPYTDILQLIPNKVIATSTSPYDKFPLTRSFNDDRKGRYRYLGTRDRIGFQSTTALLERVVNSLLEVSAAPLEKISKLKHVFDFLGYDPAITIIYELEVPFQRLFSLLCELNEEDLYRAARNPRIAQALAKITHDDILRFNVIDSLRVLEYSGDFFKGRSFSVDLSFESNFLPFELMRVFSGTSLLRDTGLMRLSDIILHSKKSDSSFSIRDASSGQQCIIATILGIASEIENNSLICIDEPEISLHPEWQEKFVDLLIKTFNDYNGCHFIIATHSPQIISRVKGGNCSILKMETGEIFSANDYYKRSADYQLATILNAPGFSNEYLSRECLSIISRISKDAIDESTHLKIRNLSSLRKLLDDSDPVAGLIDAINLAVGN